MKRITGLFVSFCLLLSLCAPFAFAEGADDDYRDVLVFDGTKRISQFIQEPWPKGEIRICPAVLDTADGSRDVYLVTVRGIDWSAQRANNLMAYFFLLCNRDCRYYNMVKDAIFEYVPAGAAIVIAGHSLGGMVTQRVICDDDLTEAYEFLNAVTFGSPYVVVDKDKREGNLVRLEDTDDVVPKFSLAAFLSPEDYNGAVKLSGGYADNLSDAHNASYQEADVWETFDALGINGGGAVLTLALEGLVTLSAK